jgi:hypothetical protein
LDINIHITQNGKTRSEPGHSWTRNGWNWLFACMSDACAVGTAFGAGNMVVKDTGNTLRTNDLTTANRGSSATPSTSYGMAYSGTANSAGIVVGSNNTPFSPDDYRLLSQYSALNISHYAMERAVFTYDAVNKIWKATHYREFTNPSSTLTFYIREVGLVSRLQCFSSATYITLLIARDVLETEIELVPLGIVGIGYEISMDYSEID